MAYCRHQGTHVPSKVDRLSPGKLTQRASIVDGKAGAVTSPGASPAGISFGQAVPLSNREPTAGHFDVRGFECRSWREKVC